MKNIYIILSVLSILLLPVACSDDPLIQSDADLEKDTNYSEFADGYSVAFDVTVDQLGGNFATRANTDDYELAELENYLNPEEFRIFFFTEDDKFLFESKSRWLTEIDSKDGNRRWRVGVPIFQYLSDNAGKDEEGKYEMEEYHWDEIVDYMKNNSFKIAILANRPTNVNIPLINDFPEGDPGKNDPEESDYDWRNAWAPYKYGKAENGPNWGPENSYAAYTDKSDSRIRDVFDLHHAQKDPVYLSKSASAIKNEANTEVLSMQDNGYYDIISETDPTDKLPNGSGGTIDMLYMGAFITWLNEKPISITNSNTVSQQSTYRLLKPIRTPAMLDTDEISSEEMYIPMYGIQKFGALTDWTKGTTYNISTQTASQSTSYTYKTIFLLRCVVKLELRIPTIDADGNEVDLDLEHAQLYYNNVMSRCEPMDTWTPTDELWAADHSSDCEWERIRDFGPFANGDEDDQFKNRLSWYYACWQEKGWDFTEKNINKTKGTWTQIYSSSIKSPRIFNPMVQRLKCAYIRTCYLPIGDLDENGKVIPSKNSYHRWVIYCGERNINDPNFLGTLAKGKSSYLSYFKIKRNGNPSEEVNDVIYTIPIVDYSYRPRTNYVYNKLTGDQTPITNISAGQSWMESSPNYFDNIRDCKDAEMLPYPLLRNHFYRLTVSFGSNENINVEIMDAQNRGNYEDRFSDLITFK